LNKGNVIVYQPSLNYFTAASPHQPLLSLALPTTPNNVHLFTQPALFLPVSISPISASLTGHCLLQSSLTTTQAMTDEWDTNQAEVSGDWENSTAEVTDGDGWFNSAADAEYTWDLPEEEVTTAKNSTTATESDGFQLQGKRLRRKDVRQHKASKRSTREHGAIEVSRDVPEEHHFKEKFAQRGDKRKSRKAEWKSELDQMAELRQRLQKLGGRTGFGSDTSKQLIVPSNPLVAK
jgi:hypothetical protein